MDTMTPDECDALLTRQENRCAICGTDEDDVDRTTLGGRPRKDGTVCTRFVLAVDHYLDSTIGISTFADDVIGCAQPRPTSNANRS